ncbi:MAG: RNA polymerase sigma factor [Pseudonocardiaceae bacterium]
MTGCRDPDPAPERVADDDPPGWDAVVGFYQDLQTEARRTAAGVLGFHDPDEIEDVIHESIVKAARALHTLRRPERVRTWFLKIVVRTALDHLRVRRRRRSKESLVGSCWDLEQLYSASARGGLSPEEPPGLLAAVEFLNTLSLNQRVAYFLRHFSGFDRKDIAEILGCSQITVGTHLRRAQARADKRFRPAADGHALEAKLDQLRRSEA